MLWNFAELYREEGSYAEAGGFYRRALAIDEITLGANHSEAGATLNNFADLYVFERNYAEAKRIYQRGLSIWQTAFGPDHTGPDLLPTARGLLRRVGEFGGASGIAINDRWYSNLLSH